MEVFLPFDKSVSIPKINFVKIQANQNKEFKANSVLFGTDALIRFRKSFLDPQTLYEFPVSNSLIKLLPIEFYKIPLFHLPDNGPFELATPFPVLFIDKERTRELIQKNILWPALSSSIAPHSMDVNSSYSVKAPYSRYRDLRVAIDVPLTTPDGKDFHPTVKTYIIENLNTYGERFFLTRKGEERFLKTLCAEFMRCVQTAPPLIETDENRLGEDLHYRYYLKGNQLMGGYF
jgi:hypothetical protein